ncbi:MAG: porin [Alphaproteobacteria bacterium]|nr:porin [Alphaproteobacteria bacterium]
MKLKNISIGSFLIACVSLNTSTSHALDFSYNTSTTAMIVSRDQDRESDSLSEGARFYGSFSLAQKLSKQTKLGFTAVLDSDYNYSYLDRNQDFLKEAYAFLEFNSSRLELGKVKDIAAKMMVSAPDVGLMGVDRSMAYKFIYPTPGFTMIDSIASDFGEEKMGINYIYKMDNDFKVGFNFSTGDREFNKEDEFYSREDDFGSSFSLSLKKDSFYSNAFQTSVFAAILYADDTNIDGYSKASGRTEVSAGTNINYHNLVLGAGVRLIDENSPENISYEGNAYNYGLAYSFGPWEASFSVHESEAEGLVSNKRNDESKLEMLSFNYKLNKRTTLSTSFGKVEYKDETGDSNEGDLVSFGFRINLRDTINVMDSVTESSVWNDSPNY